MLKGRMQVTTEGEKAAIGLGQAAPFSANSAHGTLMLDDVECVSVKGVIGGVGRKMRD
jgi:hypothetical protein